VRYAELAAEAPARRLESAATRAADRLHEAWAARDLDRFAALLPAGFRVDDRRKTAPPEPDRGRWIDAALASPSSRRSELLATRGDRLALTHVHPEYGAGAIGSGEMGWLEILEVDDAGDPAILILFDEDDLDAAHAELDQRYERGEAAAYGHVTMTRAFRRALAARDWDALGTLLAPDLVVQDHRLLGWETLHGPGAYLEALRSLVELAPDVRL